MDTHTHTDNILKQASTHLKHETPPIPEQQLKTAIMKGIERGNKQKRINHRLLKWGLPTGAVAICALLFVIVALQPSLTTVNNNESNTNAANNKMVPIHVIDQLDTYALQSSVKHGLYQPINQTTKQDQFTFTIDGIIADGTSATIFYTMNKEQDVPWDSLTDVTLADDKGNLLTDTLNFYNDTEINSKASATSILRGKFKMTYQPGELPSTITMKATPILSYIESPSLLSKEEVKSKIKTGKEFQVKIPINTSSFTELVKEIPINKQIKSDEYDFTVVKAILRPMSTELQIKMSEPNPTLFNNFIDPVLILSDGERYLSTKRIKTSTRPISHQNTNGTITIYFDSMYYLTHNTISFQAAGIEMNFEEQPKLVIDTAKKQILNVLDKPFTLDKVENIDQSNTTEIHLKINKRHNADGGMINAFELYDANGTKYPISFTGHGVGSGNGSKENQSSQELTFILDTRNYAQPLTFYLNGYFQHILHNIDFPLIQGSK